VAGRLVIYGATGATGRRIASLAVEAGLTPVLCGRRRDALHDLAGRLGLTAGSASGADCVRVADAADPAALGAAFAGADVVANCSGPYTRLGPPVLDAAIGAGAHYLDCTGEPRWVQRIISAFEPRAVAAGVTVVPGIGLGIAHDLVARVASSACASRPSEVSSVTIGVRIVGMRPSAASVRSTVEMLAGGAPVS